MDKSIKHAPVNKNWNTKPNTQTNTSIVSSIDKIVCWTNLISVLFVYLPQSAEVIELFSNVN